MSWSHRRPARIKHSAERLLLTADSVEVQLGTVLGDERRRFSAAQVRFQGKWCIVNKHSRETPSFRARPTRPGRYLHYHSHSASFASDFADKSVGKHASCKPETSWTQPRRKNTRKSRSPLSPFETLSLDTFPRTPPRTNSNVWTMSPGWYHLLFGSRPSTS